MWSPKIKSENGQKRTEQKKSPLEIPAFFACPLPVSCLPACPFCGSHLALADTCKGQLSKRRLGLKEKRTMAVTDPDQLKQKPMGFYQTLAQRLRPVVVVLRLLKEFAILIQVLIAIFWR